METGSTLHVTRPSQLSGLSVFRRAAGSRRQRIAILDDRVPPDVRDEWATRINRRYAACGCGHAASAMVLGLAAFLAWLMIRPSGLAWGDLWRGVVVLMVATAAGKVAGLWSAQRKLRRVVKAIHDDWVSSARDLERVA